MNDEPRSARHRVNRRRALCVASLSIAGGLALACTTTGDRSGAWIRTADGGALCPEGERCSSQAPGGLLFRSPSSPTLGQTVRPTAVGGMQTVEFSPGATIDTTVSVEQGPLAATTLDRRSRFTHTPTSAGISVIAVREAASGALLDRVRLEALAVSSVALDATGEWPWPAMPLGALWLGSEARVRILPLDATGAPLQAADERQSLRSRAPSIVANGPFGLDLPAISDPRSPPLARETLAARSLGTATLDVRFGQVIRAISVPVVDRADALEVRSAQTRAALRSPWRDAQNAFTVCALAGGAPVVNAPVVVRALPSQCSVAADVGRGASALWILCESSSAAPVRAPARFAIGSVELAGEIEITPPEA